MEYMKQYEILVKKAKDDYNTAKLVFNNIENINIDIALFHLQQAVEKSLKALLVFNKIEFPKTHKLDILIDILRHEFTGYNKIIWILVIIFFPVLGAILYLVFGRGQRIKK